MNWIQMAAVVGLSGLAYALGYLMGLRRMNRKWQKSMEPIAAAVPKLMAQRDALAAQVRLATGKGVAQAGKRE